VHALADRENKWPFGATTAAPPQRAWCWLGGAGWERGAPQGCPGGTVGGETQWHTGRAHAQPGAPPRHGARFAYDSHSAPRKL
jgi:hypothetical protein